MDELLRGLEKKIRALEEENEELRNAAYRDPLTGLENRRGLHEKEKGREASRKPFSLLMLDIDHFKKLNDTYGHIVGDEVLKQVAAHLRERTRAHDIVSRWGGEEFVVVFKDTDPQDILDKFYDKEDRRSEIHFEVEAEGRTIPVTLSGGLTSFGAGEDLRETIIRADRALYASKENGRNRITDHGALEPNEERLAGKT